MFISLLLFVVVIGLLVFVHEAGHFFAARIFKVKVDEFGFGFPPRIFGIKRNGTIYSVNWIPLGGFVKIKGESGEHTGEPDSFAHRPAWQRSVILLAGVFMNILLAWALFAVGFSIGIPGVLNDLPAGARVRDAHIEIVEILKGSSAEFAGIHVGDRVVRVDEASPTSVDALRQLVADSEGKEMRVVLQSDGKDREVTVTPRKLAETGKPGLGVSLVEFGIVSFSLPRAIIFGALSAGQGLWDIIRSFGLVIADLARAHKPSADFFGPVGIAVTTARVARFGFLHLMLFTALLSLNLAVVNAIPFPALDGGRFLFVLIEKIRGKPLKGRFEQVAHLVGFALLIGLVLVVTYKDIVRLAGVGN